MPQQQTNERIKERTRYNFPKLYKVIIFNDEITTMDFVVMILRKVFHKDEGEAERLMLDVHNNGRLLLRYGKDKSGTGNHDGTGKGFPAPTRLPAGIEQPARPWTKHHPGSTKAHHALEKANYVPAKNNFSLGKRQIQLEQ